MARVTSNLAAIALKTLHIAESEVLATGDPETLLWALDQIHQADAWLKMVMAEHDAPPDEAGANPQPD